MPFTHARACRRRRCMAKSRPACLSSAAPPPLIRRPQTATVPFKCCALTFSFLLALLSWLSNRHLIRPFKRFYLSPFFTRSFTLLLCLPVTPSAPLIFHSFSSTSLRACVNPPRSVRNRQPPNLFSRDSTLRERRITSCLVRHKQACCNSWS